MILVDDIVVAAALITLLIISRPFKRGRAGQLPSVLPPLSRTRYPGPALMAVLLPSILGRATWRRRVRPGCEQAGGNWAAASLASLPARGNDEQFHRTLELFPFPVLVANGQGKIVAANSATVKLFGYSCDELIGAPVDMLAPPLQGDFPQTQSSNIASARLGREAGHSCDRFARCKDGTEFPAEITAVPICAIGASDTLTIVMDRTDRYELLRNRQELAHLSRVSTLGELAGSLAHELNQPLTAILSNAQAAQRFMATQPIDLVEVREILEDLVKDNHRASEVLRKIRVLVKKGEPETALLRLDSVVGDVALLAHSDAIGRGIRMYLDIPADLPSVQGDRVQLQQVVLNVLLNSFEALESCPAHDRVVMIDAALDSAEMIRVAVRDRGPGLSTDKLDKLFTPYFTSKREGLGLGLSISRSIVQMHGGRIWAENNEHQGATFYFTLPAVSAGPRMQSGEKP
jgi:two-component system sensor kinase FixL